MLSQIVEQLLIVFPLPWVSKGIFVRTFIFQVVAFLEVVRVGVPAFFIFRGLCQGLNVPLDFLYLVVLCVELIGFKRHLLLQFLDLLFLTLYLTRQLLQ